MKKRYFLLLTGLLLAVASNASLFAHCQVPCGIYGDPDRFTIMEEHLTTIEKSMNSINSLSSESKPNYNQLVRWVANKEEHASQFTEIVTYYFLAQRIKPVDASDSVALKKYQKELTLLHHMIVFSMKAKQTTDLDHVKKLRALVKDFKASYLGTAEHSH